MTNYYDELKLDKNLSLNELRENLIRLESIWTDRASNRPEKAAEMLVLINQAKKVFATDMSRAAYDRELFAPPKEEKAADPNAARKAEFEKWKKTAQDYYARQEYDIAKTALDKALQNADEDDFAFLHLAAQICYSNGEYQVALSHINKALLIAPDLAELYITKALILEDLFIEESRRGFGDAAAHLQQARNTMRMASEKAAAQGNKTAEAHADGYLAFLLYFDEPKDTALAERMAKRAVENGDDWGNARRVLEDLEEKRTAAEKAAQAERERRERLAREEQERRERLEREKQARREAAERAEREKRRAAAAKRRMLIVILSVPVILVAGMLLYVRHNLTSIGSGIRYSFDEGTGELRISGKGETRDFPVSIFMGGGLSHAPWGFHRSYEELCNVIAKQQFAPEDVQSVVIEDGITYIGASLFENLRNVTQITIPESVKEIGEWAFGACEDAVVYLPNTIEHLNVQVFADCDAVEYDGTLEEWIRLCGQEDVFSTSGAEEIRCMNGSIEYQVYEDSTIYYDVTMQEMQDFLSSLGAVEDSSSRHYVDHIICSDGTLDFATLKR